MGRTRVVPGGRGGGMPGSWGWTGLAFALFPGRDLAIQRHAPSLAQEAVDAEPRGPRSLVLLRFNHAPFVRDEDRAGARLADSSRYLPVFELPNDLSLRMVVEEFAAHTHAV